MLDLSSITPVAVAIMGCHRRDIRSLSDMHEFLTEWPPSQRRMSYGAAAKACAAARAGEISPEAAREAFVQFAETAGILWPEVSPIISVKPVARGYAGFA
jgi:hypothetical protein